MATQELQSLTPLRGIAAIWVICFHYVVVYFSAFHPEQISSVLNKGYLAVDMFFMLSGFVLSHVYWGTFTSETADAGCYWKFMGARVARLYPLHLFNLCQFLVATLAFAFYQYGSAGEFNAIPIHGARSLPALARKTNGMSERSARAPTELLRRAPRAPRERIFSTTWFHSCPWIWWRGWRECF